MDAYELRDVLRDWEVGAGRPVDRLVGALTVAITGGLLAVGTRLPAERQLAGVLGVSRGTVVRAYARLRDDRLVHTRHGSGTAVGSGDRRGRAASPATRLSASSINAVMAGPRVEGVDLRVAAWDADADLLRELELPTSEEFRAVAAGTAGYWPLGHPILRAALANHLTTLGLPTEADQIIVTNGGQQAVDVLLTARLTPGDPVLLEDVSWSGILELLTLRHLRASTVPEAAKDPVALVRALRERRADLAFLIPSHHNPTGAVMPPHVRRLVVEAAAEGGVLLIDDLIFHELWIDEPPPPPLAATVPELAEHVVTVGSLSKLVWGGLRVGWIRAEPAQVPQLARVKTAIDLGMAVSPQLAAARTLANLDPVLTRRRSLLRERRAALADALTERLPEWTFEMPAGGMSMWVGLGGVSGDAVAAAAAGHGVLVPPARACSSLGRDLDRVRLTLSRPPDDLRRAVDGLALAWRDVQRREAPGAGTLVG